MGKRCLFLSMLFASFALCSCSSGEVQIEQESESSSGSSLDYSIPDDAVVENLDENPAVGDRLFAEGLIYPLGSGEIYFTINKATAFTSMQEAGLKLSDMYEKEFKASDGFNEGDWDPAKETFTDKNILIVLDVTIENISAVSSRAVEDPEEYDDSDFRIDGLGTCSHGSLRYFSEMGKCSANVRAFHLEPGQSVTVKVGYLVYLPDVELKDMQFLTPSTQVKNSDDLAIDLNLS